MSILDKIDKQVHADHLVLYMKGTPQEPMCGFSAQVVHALQELNLEFKSYNVLEDEELRRGIKEYGEWPTIPQLYVEGDLLGGCDIVMDLYENDALIKYINGEKI